MRRILAMVLALAMMLILTASAEDVTALSVRGTGVVSVSADQVCVVLGVREVMADVLELQSTVNAKINAIYDALVEAGADGQSIATESLYIYANYDYSGDEEQLTGYTATNTISITTSDIDKMGEYIDIAFENGANTLEDVSFSLQDTTETNEQALELAVQNAFDKAEVIANAAGLQISSIKSIDATSSSYYSDSSALYGVRTTEESATTDTSTSLQASVLQVTASVLIEFELVAKE